MSDLIERLEKIAEASKRAFTDVSEACAEAAARIKELEALAKCDSCGKPFDENGSICEPCHSSAIAQHIKPLGARIKELEAERNKYRMKCDDLSVEISARNIRIGDLEDERGAIEAETIRNCAVAAGSMSTEGLGTFEERLKIQQALCLAADRIRALAKPKPE